MHLLFLTVTEGNGYHRHMQEGVPSLAGGRARRWADHRTRRRGDIVDAAVRAIRRRGSGVTMEEIAAEAGVSYQTVYAVFGNKLRVAQAIIEAGWPHVTAALELFEDGRRSDDPEVWLRVASRVSRAIYELCADMPRFMRESGDPTLRARYKSTEDERYRQLKEVRDRLETSGRLRHGLTASEGHAILWSLTGPDYYCLLVFERKWKPARYEEWLGQSLIDLLLQPRAGMEASRTEVRGGQDDRGPSGVRAGHD